MKPILCKQCGSAMINASLYDPEGRIKLSGGYKEYKEGELVKWFVCINCRCPDGKLNTESIVAESAY